ncbi:hypothetical protein DS2_01070 [Catenovulum agarivorans DS-2]|uniref:Uncharacterized protein n=1 Tax=Catenovulum agarivorans DS-2 TaxID=1328313 RepID=W7QH52_9ALTE|nr:hypothetical protein [Catenovulum agarivorans]EWH12269.1 hypothetical protein DS2_01070 [Catenovulum agarivorans DS-2]
MQLSCPNCRHCIHETKTYDLNTNSIRPRMLCPNCQMGLKVILFGQATHYLTANRVVYTMIFCLILQAVSLIWSIAWLAIAAHAVLIAFPSCLLLLDRISKRPTRIELQLERIVSKKIS